MTRIRKWLYRAIGVGVCDGEERVGVAVVLMPGLRGAPGIEIDGITDYGVGECGGVVVAPVGSAAGIAVG